MTTPAPRKAGRPLTLPEGNNPMAKFMRDYYAKFGIMLPIATIAKEMNSDPSAVGRWRRGERQMRGATLVAFEAMKKKYL